MAKYGDLFRGAPVILNGRDGRVIDKNNGSKNVLVLLDGIHQCWAPAAEVVERTEPSWHQIHPMLAYDVKDRRVTLDQLMDDPNWWLEQKYDGERVILTLGLGGKMRATTRDVGKLTGLLGNNSALVQEFMPKQLKMPTNGITVLDGEVVHPMGFSTLRKIMGSNPEKARARMEEFGPPQIMVFDCLWRDGRDMRHESFAKRREELEREMSTWHASVLWRLSPSPMACLKASKEAMLEEIGRQGGEGAMLKDSRAPYTDTSRPDRRSPYLLKVKPFTSGEFVVTAVIPGAGKYNTDDPMAAVELSEFVDGKLMPVSRCGFGGKLLEAVGLPVTVDAVLGQWLEVKYQQRGSQNGLRHPTALRLRTDKERVTLPVETA